MTLVLLFSLADELYGLEVESIQEIVEDPQRHFVPRASGALQGAINCHGRILPVIDLPQLLGFTGAARDRRLVVLSREFHSLALIVTRVGRIVTLDFTEQHPVSNECRSQAVRSVVCHEERLVNLLDADALIDHLKLSFPG